VERQVRGMEVSHARRLRQLEGENRKLKHTVAELLLDKRALQAVVEKEWGARRCGERSCW